MLCANGFSSDFLHFLLSNVTPSALSAIVSALRYESYYSRENRILNFRRTAGLFGDHTDLVGGDSLNADTMAPQAH